MGKARSATLIIGCYLLVQSSFCFAGQNAPTLASGEDARAKIFMRAKIERQGHAYLRSFHFERALEKYNEAANPIYNTGGSADRFPIWLKVNVLVYQGEYDTALELYRVHYLEGRNVNEEAMERGEKIKAMIVYDKLGDDSKVHRFIGHMKEKYTQYLPPKKLAAHSDIVFRELVELYDLVGDYDAAIELTKSFKKKTKSKRMKPEYENIIKALEESKAGMPKICGDGGKTCVGRATAYIIQSDKI